MNTPPTPPHSLEALEEVLRRGSLSQDTLGSYLELDLPVQVRIELEWMLHTIRQLEEHRSRLVQRLGEFTR
ncbi:MAG: hypothetical protein VKK99_07910 [Cyanobacteriota bacterium]|nr:hypothetical protein [Cyanobacteriota bacterium]